MTDDHFETLSISRNFNIPASKVWDAMRWDNTEFFADIGLFSKVDFKNPYGQWAKAPSPRTVHLIGEGAIDETLTFVDERAMHLRFELDEPEQYGLRFFEGTYRVKALGIDRSSLTNSARFQVGSRTLEDMQETWPETQITLFEHIESRLG